MKIEQNKFVALSYELTVDGEIADKATDQKPLKFLFGMGYLLPKFEENIAGKQAGDKFAFTLAPEEGYGEYNLENIITLPLEVFQINGVVEDGLLTVGNAIPMQTQDHRQMMGIVREVTTEGVRMDFNHPMAGKTLNFTGEILEVREPEESDFPQHGHSCDCGCDSCGDEGCDGGCEGGCH